jgi:hypothetical protein
MALARHLCASTGGGEEGTTAAAVAASAALTEEELQEYVREGLVVPKGWRLPDAMAVARLRDLVQRTLAVTCECSPPVLMPVGPHLPTNLYGSHGRDIPEELAASWMRLAMHPNILALVHSVLGPDVYVAVFARLRLICSSLAVCGPHPLTVSMSDRIVVCVGEW